MLENDRFENSQRFYENEVAGMIKAEFPRYEDRIAVGIAGEGSDCFGYDDYISRDHDFGTGVCLWLNDRDMNEFGSELAEAYDRLVDRHGGGGLSQRLRERRGVMTVHDFYSNILGIDCDTDNCRISIEDWQKMDHSCLATAVNGEVFRDDSGGFTAFRKLLLAYYPEDVWRYRIVEELHKFSASVQVNYARCMTRGDSVAGRLCHMQGLQAAMQLFFLLKREYMPFYKWSFRRMTELDKMGRFSQLITEFAQTDCDLKAWEGREYRADKLNMSDRIVDLTEKIAGQIVTMLGQRGLVRRQDPYLEIYVDEILQTIQE